ncbi:tyrosine--tRNA ligase [Candidatus Dojkabacteria bacterium]|uniref:Tyrosine--tRNA ligase n=1 Tax=Candidatus Dojkabacteria bacterium TaxID=2099670 RepID=A0A955L3F9_9BACT|nr:tyrosine--tRNA ligase [Candidatus Dojkabacteria bacterium]
MKTKDSKFDELFTRGVHEVFTRKELEEKLNSGKPLSLKLGTDVTGANLTLGHAVVHRKLRDFQELGHKVVLIIGDFTTLVGDHSDKVEMRQETTSEEIRKNEQTYTDQFFKTVHKEGTEIVHNSDWLKELDFNDVINLAKKFTLQQMFDREAFQLRYKNNKPIGLDEFLYPLMQGFDSIHLKSDVEFGGTDQTFNLLAGRKLMPEFGLDPQCAIAMKLLTGNDGRPMGKSLKNFIPIMDNPNDMFGKVMSIVDEVIIEYFELVTRVPMSEVKEMEAEMKAGKVNPMELKKKLAGEIVTFYHSKEAAIEAEQRFRSTVQNKAEITELPEVKVEKGKVKLMDLLKLVNPNESAGDIKRVIRQGGVSISGKAINDPNEIVRIRGGEVIKYGKKVFVRVV